MSSPSHFIDIREPSHIIKIEPETNGTSTQESGIYLPNGAYKRLVHLSFLKPHQSILTENAEKTLTIARWAKFINQAGLRYGWACVAGGVLTASLISLSYNPSLILGVSTTAGLIANLLAFIFTGNLPDWESNTANDKQDMLHRLQEDYTQIAIELIHLSHKNYPQALVFARSLNQETLETTAKRIGLTLLECQDLIHHLMHAKVYVETGKLPQEDYVLRTAVLAEEFLLRPAAI